MCAPCARARAIYRFAVDPTRSRLFGILLELLLEGGELGERRIGIRLLVAAIGMTAVRLGVILLALGAFHTVALVAARTLAAVGSSFAFNALALALQALLALVALLALLTVLALSERNA